MTSISGTTLSTASSITSTSSTASSVQATTSAVPVPPRQQEKQEVKQGVISQHARCARVPTPTFHRFACDLTVEAKGQSSQPEIKKDFVAEVDGECVILRHKPINTHGVSLFVPLLQDRIMEDAHRYLATKNETPMKCYVHDNPSVFGRTGIFCDRLFPSLAKRAYLYNEIDMPLAEFNTYANCQNPSGWGVCEFSAEAAAEQLEKPFSLPGFEDRTLECACVLLDALTLEQNGFSRQVQFEAAYLAVYLHHNQDHFEGVDDLVEFAGSYFLLALPLYYQQGISQFDDEYFQEIFCAALKDSRVETDLGDAQDALSAFYSSELTDSLLVLACLLFAPAKQLREADFSKMQLPQRTWGLPDFSPVISAVQSAASISVQIKNLPAPAVELLLKRDIDLDGLISDLLGQVHWHI